MILNLFFLFLWANPHCDNQVVTHKDYSALQKKIENRITQSAELIAIANEADSVLSKLISSKSPVLLTWLEKRDLMTSQEEIIAKQWRQYYFENFVLNQYPTKNLAINRSVENLFKQISEDSFDSIFKSKLEKILKDVKKEAKKVILGWPIAKVEKQKIIHRIDTIQLYWFDQLKDGPFAKSPQEFIHWGLAYDPPHNRINVGVEAKMYPTDANLFAILSHEMGHAFDPCRWSFYFQTENPFQNLITCFRDTKKLGAKKRDDSKMKWAVENNKLTQEMATSLEQHPSCNRSFYPPAGTQKEQNLEVFADWFSAEVFAESEFANQFPRPDLCASKKLTDGSSYLPNEDRLSKIYLSHPKLVPNKSEKPNHYCPLKLAKD